VILVPRLFVEVYPIIFNTRKPDIAKQFGNKVDTSILLLAHDPYSNEQIGYKYIELCRHYDYIKSSPFIRTMGSRGVASALEMASEVVYSSLKDIYNSDYTQFMININDLNKRDLDELENLYLESPSDNLLELVTAKRNERERWLALYGPNGGLGNTFDSVNQLGRLFFARDIGMDEKTTHVYVQKGHRISSNGRRLLIPKIISIGSDEDSETAKLSRRNAILKVI
jgi:hypothetical protein